MPKRFAWTAKRTSSKDRVVLSARKVEKRGGFTRLPVLFFLLIRKNYSISILICLVLISFIALAYHPFFRLSKVSIHGNVRLTDEYLQSFVQKHLKETKFFISKSSIFIFSDDDLSKKLVKELPIEDAKVVIFFPNTIEITIQEKKPAALVSNGVEYVLVDSRGMFLEKAGNVPAEEWKPITLRESYVTTTVIMSSGTPIFSTTTAYFSTTTMVYSPNMSSVESVFGNMPLLVSIFATSSESFWSTEQVISVVDWMSTLDKNTPHSWAKVAYVMEIEGDSLMAVLSNKNGKLYVKKTITETEVKNALAVVEKENSSNKFSSIDLRYLPKIFWK